MVFLQAPSSPPFSTGEKCDPALGQVYNDLWPKIEKKGLNDILHAAQGVSEKRRGAQGVSEQGGPGCLRKGWPRVSQKSGGRPRVSQKRGA